MMSVSSLLNSFRTKLPTRNPVETQEAGTTLLHCEGTASQNWLLTTPVNSGWSNFKALFHTLKDSPRSTHNPIIIEASNQYASDPIFQQRFIQGGFQLSAAIEKAKQLGIDIEIQG